MNGNGIPPGWIWATFSEVAHIASNLVDPREKGHLPHIAPDTIERDTGRLLPFNTVSQDQVTSPKHLFRPGQVLYSKIRPYLNKCVRVNFDGLCSADMYPLDVFIDAAYLHRYILTRSFVSAVSDAAGSRTVLPKTNQKQLALVPIPVPPLREQHRIVEAIESYLTRLDDTVTTLERVQRNLKRYRASVLKAAVEGRLVPTEAELARAEGRDYEPASVLLERILAERRRQWQESGRRGTYRQPLAPNITGLPTLPEGWCWASIDQVGYVSGGLTKNAGRAAHDRIVPYLRVANVYADELRLDDVSEIGIRDSEMEKLLLKKGDLLVVEGNGSIEQIGRVAIWDGSIDGCAHQNHIIKVRFCLVSMGAWALRWLLSPGGRQGIESEASSTSGLHTLSISKVARLPIPLCPVAEQCRITSEADRFLSITSSCSTIAQRSQKRAARLRQSILKWAFEGRLADQDPSDEPASALLERIRSQTSASRQSGSDAEVSPMMGAN